jgi:hypothetical protein
MLAAELIRDITEDRLVELPPLNPTQTVVVALVNKLPVETYHVIVDNLFSSPNLFKALRIIGVGATGTCRTSCGLYCHIADLKEIDRKGQLKWTWGQLEAWPTPDNKVSRKIRAPASHSYIYIYIAIAMTS